MLLSYTAFLTFLLLSFHSKAQYEPILDTNKVWHASAFRMAFTDRTEETYHLRDSVEIEGQTYISAFADTPASSGTFIHGFFREDTIAGKLFFRAALTTYPDDDTIYSPEITTVDLSLTTGQTYFHKFILLFYNDDNNIEFAVDSIEHLVVDAGILENRVYVELEVQNESMADFLYNPWNSDIGDTEDQMTSLVVNQRFIEGVGSNFGLFFPVVDSDFPFFYPQEPYVLCMSKSDSTVWIDPFSLNCQFIVLSDPELAHTMGNINVFPNPAKDRFSLQLVTSAPLNDRIESIQIIDLSGRMVASYAWGNGVFDVSDVASGMYLLTVIGSDGAAIAVERLVMN